MPVNETYHHVTASNDLRVDSRFFLATAAGASWMVGIWLASVLNISPYLWLALALVNAAGAGLLWRRGRWGLVLAATAALALGSARFVLAQPRSDPGYIHYYNGARDLAVIGEVDAEPQPDDTRIRLRVDVRQVVIDGQTRPVEGILLVETNRFPVIDYGASIELSGDLYAPDVISSPSYAAYLLRDGITSVMRYPDVDVLDSKGGSPFFRTMLAVRQRGREVIRAGVPEPYAALLNGILLGDDSGMPDWLNDAFRETGMTHIIAISGFNIALIIALLDRLSGPFLPRRWAAVLIMVFISLYAVLVGAQASVVRAAIMGAAYLAGLRLLGRPTLAIAGLFSAAFVMTLANPNTLWDIGFQLSFAATLGLLLFASRWTRRIESSFSARLPSASQKATAWLLDFVMVTFAAQFLTVPLILYHFGRLSVASLPANFLVLPAQPGVMFTGGIVLLMGMVFPDISRAIGWIAWPFLAYTVGAIHLLSRLPFASVPLRFSFPALIAVYGVIALLTLLTFTDVEKRRILTDQIPLKRRGMIGASIGILGLILLFTWLSGRPDGRLHVAFLDIGQGDAILIQSPSGQQLLIDGGRYPSVVLDELGKQIPFWDRSIDMVLATHSDEDHIAGLVSVLERYKVSSLITGNIEAAGDPTFEALLAVADEMGTPVHSAQTGEVIVLDEGVRLQILYVGNVNAEDSMNDASIVARLEYGDLSILLTGDAEARTETHLLQTGQPLNSLILKAGHHGANTSSSQPFLTAVTPQIIVISVGRDNSYGHPSPAMLERAEAIGALVLRTDESGTLEVETDGRQMWWKAERQGVDDFLP